MDDKWGNIYSKNQIEEARKGFPFEKALQLIQRSAECPTTMKSDTNYLDLIQMGGTAMAYRKRSLVSANECYLEEFKELKATAHRCMYVLSICRNNTMSLVSKRSVVQKVSCSKILSLSQHNANLLQ